MKDNIEQEQDGRESGRKNKGFQGPITCGRQEGDCFLPHQLYIEKYQGGGYGPGQAPDQGADGEFAHGRLITYKMDQGDDGETELYAQDDLAQYQEIVGPGLSGNQDNGHGGQDGQQASEQSSQPGIDAYLKVSFHDDLPREGTGDRRALARGDQGDGE